MDSITALVLFLIFALFTILVTFSKRPTALLHLVVGGLGIIYSLYLYDAYTTIWGLGFSIVIMIFAVVNIGEAIKLIFWPKKKPESED